jgi:hypothetical protein
MKVMIRSEYSEAFKALSKKEVFSSSEGREAGIPPRMSDQSAFGPQLSPNLECPLYAKLQVFSTLN